jgi:hypothetical protein
VDGRLLDIADDDALYRRIAPHCFKRDGTISSSAFMTNNVPDDQISVDLARLTTADESLARAPRPGFGLGDLLASEPRRLGFTVRHDPIPENPAHALIEGQNTKELCRRLAEKLLVLRRP